MSRRLLDYGSAAVLLECADLDEAIEVARAHPMARGGRLEIRPFADFEQ
jgi:hypothetical protein